MTNDEDRTDFIFAMLGLATPQAMMRAYERDHYKEQDEKPISDKIRLLTGLRRYRIQWINGIALHYKLSTRAVKKDKIESIANTITSNLSSIIQNLPQECQEALKICFDNGGWVKYSKISRLYGNEGQDGFFWEKTPPTSVIGVLRHRGLVFIGKLGIDGRNHQVIVIPSDLRKQVGLILA